MSKKIIAGPWWAEFGWELMRWQGIFRNLAHKGYKIVMVSRPGHEALYEDYIEDYIGVEAPSGDTDGWRINGKVEYLSKDLLDNYPGYKYMDPTTCMKIGVDPLGSGQKFIRYGENCQIEAHNYILVHPRSTTKCKTDIRNWSKENWKELCYKIRSLGFLVGVIGSKSGSLELQEENDFRGVPLNKLICLMRSARLVIGPSSGPMHLASLCGTPHVYWTDTKYWGSCCGTNRYRYEVSWNPLGTKSFGIDQFNWQPPVDVVYNEIIKALEWVKQNK